MGAPMASNQALPVPSHDSAAAPRVAGRLVDRAVVNAFPIALVFILAMTLSAVGPVLFVGDSWMTLVAGREVWASGLPDRETLTVLGAGSRWIDQQWLAQLVYYATERIGGLSAVATLGVLVATAGLGLSVATSRLLGASARSTFLVGGVSFFVAPWAWQVRAQGLALPLFAATLLLSATHVRTPSRRLWLALPLLLLWANVHGSVLLGAMIVSLAAVGGAITSSRNGRSRWSDLALAPAAWVCALATPYGVGIADYYRLLLVDPPFAGLVVEWQRTRPSVITATFYVVAAATILLAIRYRRRLTWFELVVLAMTLAGALQAVRGVVWFAVVVAALLPNALDGVFKRKDVIAPRRANLVLIGLLASAATLAFTANLFRADAAFERTWPTGAIDVLAAAGPSARVFPTDKHANWILWRLPELRGRVAFDVRFELLTRAEVVALARYTSEVGESWQAATDGYEIVVLDPRDPPSHLDDLLAEPGTRLVYRDERIEILRRV